MKPIILDSALGTELENRGASVVGGCCRTITEHIKEIKKIVDSL